MSTTLKALRRYTPPEREPIVLEPGQTVLVGEEDTEHPQWVNWVWCTPISGDSAGWVPRQYLNIEGETGTATRYYSARELHVETGDRLALKYRLNGWAWCEDAGGRRGWVPLEVFGSEHGEG